MKWIPHYIGMVLLWTNSLTSELTGAMIGKIYSDSVVRRMKSLRLMGDHQEDQEQGLREWLSGAEGFQGFAMGATGTPHPDFPPSPKA